MNGCKSSPISRKGKGTLTKFFQKLTLMLIALLFSQGFLHAEGSVDFRNDSGKRLFYWANEQQQIKVYAQSGEFLNIGSSHIGVNGGYVTIYRPDGSLAGIYQNLGLGAGLGIINNDVEELNGPTGGGTVNGTGYVPIVQPIANGEEGIWTIVFGFPNIVQNGQYTFTNLENNEAWDRATNQPDRWAIVAWDVTVSTTTAANEGGNMLTGRVFTNQYKGIVTGNDNVTSPTFYMMSKEGVQYQLDFNDIDPYGFNFSSNSVGLVDHLLKPAYASKATTDYTVSSDLNTWTAGNNYLYDPQGQDEESISNLKIFFNTPDATMPSSALTSNPFTSESYDTWLTETPGSDPFDVTGFEYVATDENGDPICFGNLVEQTGEGIITFISNTNGTAILSLDLNNDGDYADDVDRIIYGVAEVGDNEIIWDGKDGNGNILTITDNFEINYSLDMRLGEIHVMLYDIENNTGGLTFTRLNGVNAPDNNFYYNHTDVGGPTSGGSAPSYQPTTTPYTYDSNWGNGKLLDYWSYQDVTGGITGKWIVDIVPDCSMPLLTDTDSDGINDDMDLDDDNDGIPDTEEFCNSTGGFTCLPNGIDPSGDEDADNVPNVYDADDVAVSNPCTDSDGNGVCDEIASIYDTDADGVPDHMDLDSDNDGIPDMVEAGHGLADADQDARIDGLPADFGSNGLFNNISDDPNSPTAVINYSIFNTNNDANPDHDNVDSDGDGIFDVLESPQADGDFDGMVGTGTPKVDSDGLPFADENNNPIVVVFSPKNLDGDAFADYRDIDRDGDGISDAYECPNPMDCADSDNDGNFDVDETDSDNDGITDAVECPSGNPCPDVDGNLVDDFQEFNCSGIALPSLVAVDSVLCVGETISISTTPVAASNVSYEWFFNNGSSNLSLGITGDPNFFINFANTTHAGSYTVQVKAGLCSSPVSNGTPIYVYATDSPIAVNNSTSAFPACEGENLQLEVPVLLDATYNWTGPNGFTSTDANPIISNISNDNAGNYFAEVTLSDGCAVVASTSTTVFVQSAPAPAQVSDINPICEGNDLVLTANPIGVQPNASLNFEWFYENGTSIGTTTDTEFTVPNIDASAAGNYYVVMTVGNCIAAPSDMVAVQVTNLDNNAIAGTDQSVCGLGNATLAATLPTSGTGEWTSTTGAIIFNPEDINTAVTNMTEGNNVFVWTISNGNCVNYATDTVVINYLDATTDVANVMDDFGVCDQATTTLSATAPATAFGVWTQPLAQQQAGVTISNNTSATPTIDGLISGNNYVFTWTLSEGTCFDYDSDEVMIQVSDMPNLSANVDVEERFTCGDNELTIMANNPTVGTGQWTTTSTATIVNPDNFMTDVDDLPVGGHVFVWSLTSGACVDYDADTMVVYVEEEIEVNDDNYTISFNERIVDEDALVNDLIGFVSELNMTVVQEPTKGTVDWTDGIFTYTPNHNAFGVDEFVYEVCNANCADDCKTATVKIAINGLNEAGECWVLIPCADNFQDNELMVFNRWGDKVFEEANYQNNWDCTYRGNTLPAGTYYYVFKLGNNADPIQGFFTIMR